MKKLLYTIIGLSLLIAACKPEIKGELGEPFDKVKGISGSWEIGAFKQRDENNPIKEVRDLSEFYVNTDVAPTKITFNPSDATFEVIPGAGKNYFGVGGTWRFDNPSYPTSLILETETDTTSLKLGSMPREIDSSLDIELPRFCVDNLGVASPTVTYIITLKRAQ